MSKYFIRGTISAVCNEGNITKIRISPTAGFISPDKKHAIAFSDAQDKALLIGMKDSKWISCSVDGGLGSLLLTIAGQQKLVELRLEKDKKIVGFVFPSP